MHFQIVSTTEKESLKNMKNKTKNIEIQGETIQTAYSFHLTRIA